MIYVSVEGTKSEGRGYAGGNGWHDTDDVVAAIAGQLRRFDDMWTALGHGAAVSYRIEVATEASPRRTIGPRAGLPLPVRESS